MIRPAECEELRGIGATDPFFTRILSLYESYGEGYDFVGFWVQEIGGAVAAALSRFEDKFSLYMTDRCDREETAAFLRFQGAGSAMLSAADPLGDCFSKPCICGEVLEYTGKDYISDKEIYEPDFEALYRLLKTCESPVFRVPERLVFLSDLTHRKNKGKLQTAAIAANGVPASCVMTVSQTERAAILGAVATHPDHRRRGYSRELVRTMATRLRREGRRVFVFSAAAENTRFYENSGFTVIDRFKEILFDERII